MARSDAKPQCRWRKPQGAPLVTTGAPVEIIAAMSRSEKTHLTLELDLAPGRIRGSLQNGQADPLPFDGWLQLTNALEAARTSARDAMQGPTFASGDLDQPTTEGEKA